MPTQSPWGGGRQLSEPQLPPVLPGISPRPKSMGRLNGRPADLGEHPPPRLQLKPLRASNASQVSLIERSPMLRASAETRSRRSSKLRSSGASSLLPTPGRMEDADDTGLEARVLALELLVVEKERQAGRAAVELREEEHRRELLRLEETLWVLHVAHPSALLACEVEEAGWRLGMHIFEEQCWAEQEQAHDRQLAVARQQHTVWQLAIARQRTILMDEETIARQSLAKECWRDFYTALTAAAVRQEVVGRLAIDGEQFQALTAMARTKAALENSATFRQLWEAQRRTRMAAVEMEEAERRRKAEVLLTTAFVRLLCGAVELEEEMRREWLVDAMDGQVETEVLRWVESEEAVVRSDMVQRQAAAWTALCRYSAACKMAIRAQGDRQRQRKVLVLQRFARRCLAKWELRRRGLMNALEDSEEEDHFQTQAEFFRNGRPVGAIDQRCVTPILCPLPLQPQRVPLPVVRGRGPMDLMRNVFRSHS